MPNNTTTTERRRYDLIPTNGRKSFYGKAYVEISEDGKIETLFSYHTPIMKHIVTENKWVRLFDNEMSHTTASHIKSFCGLNKPRFEKLPMNEEVEI